MPIKLNGSSSGYTQIEAAAAAGDNTLTLPTASGTLMTTGGTNTFTANQVIEVTDNTNAALRITQLGTGAAIRVEDSTNPDSTPFVVDASGNVGIGVSSPSTLVDVSSSSARLMNLNSTSVQGPGIRFTRSGTANGYVGSAAYIVSGGAIEDFGINTSGTNRLVFGTNDTERMRVLSTGELLVGTTTSGASRVTADTLSSYAYTARINLNGEVGFQGTYIPSTGTAYYGYWRYNGSVVGSITSTGSSTVYGTSSDYRLKEDIKPVSDAKTRLMGLKPVNFAWKRDGSRTDGFIAHETAEVVPEAVTGEKDEVNEDGSIKPQGIDQSKLVPLLTAALQEALTKIDALEARIAALENA